MREILFRAKHKETGTWTFGAYCDERFEDTDFPCIIPLVDKAAEKDWEVDPETVGQYTGLRDKIGRKIFEGDITVAYYDDLYPDDRCVSEIVWDGFRWALHQAGCSQYDDLQESDCADLTVIGNVYDNPELMEAALYE